MSEDIYAWHKNEYAYKRKVPKKIDQDRSSGIYYKVDVLIPWFDGQHKMHEDADVILSFMGPEPIEYWRRSIASYQMSLPLEEAHK